MTTFYEETQERNARAGRLGKMLDQVERLNNSLRLIYDDTRTSGGSPASIAQRLACAEDAVEYVRGEIRRMAADYPVGRIPDAERVA